MRFSLGFAPWHWGKFGSCLLEAGPVRCELGPEQALGT